MPGTTSSGRLRQKSIKAYLSLFSKRQTRGTILRTEYDERPLSSLPDLPNELLLLILEYLYFHDPLSDNARKLSLVCKRLNSVYSSLALEVVRLNGAANIRKFKHLAFESTCFSVGVIK